MSSSRLSRTSSVASTYSLTSTSSSSTIWGPGTLTGKALKAFGEATLRGVEILVIRRRLSVISSHFPHDNFAVIRDIEEMYDDVLELSRPDLYSGTIRQRALNILMQQVNRRQTKYLIQSLAKWPSIEIELYASGIMDFSYGHDYSILPPRLEFICHMVHLNNSIGQFILDKGLLNMILAVCTVNCDLTDILTICDSALFACASRDPTIVHTISQHPISSLWPSWAPFFLRHSPYWEGTLWLMPQLSQAPESFERDQLFDVCIDLLELSKQESYHYNITMEAAYLLQRFVWGTAGGGEDVRRRREREVYKICCKAMDIEPTALYFPKAIRALRSEI